MLLTMFLGAEPLSPGDHIRRLTVDHRERSYLVHVPPAYEPAKPMPVVLAFHGGGTNSRQMAGFSGLNTKADEAGFLVVYPDGTGRVADLLTFNGGNCCGYAMRNNVDDVGFVQAVLDDLAQVACIDDKRIFATGMSNGAMMAYRLASELSDRIAAIAPVGGPIGTETCRPRHPVSVIHFHGTDDEFAPFEGGRGSRSLTGTNFHSVEHSIQAWIRANDCTRQPVLRHVPDAANDGTTATIKTFGGGREGAEVVLVRIEGGGHTWPGRDSTLRFLGKSTKNVSANDLMWDFFQKHPKK